MSQYLSYRLRQAGLAELRRVVIAHHPEAWVMQQLLDEFRFLYPTAVVEREGKEMGAAVDLYVMPYLTASPAAIDPGRLLRPFAPGKPAAVMLYGIPMRTIMILRAKQVSGYFARLRLVAALSTWKQRMKAMLKGHA